MITSEATNVSKETTDRFKLCGIDISLIVARSIYHIIGDNGTTPFYSSEDLVHFKKLTEGKVLIVGRKTYDNLPNLRNRTIICLTRNREFSGHIFCKPTLESALRLGFDIARDNDSTEVIIAGGASVYYSALEYVTRAYVTTVNSDCNGDTYFDEDFDNGESWAAVAYRKLSSEAFFKEYVRTR